MADWAWMPFQGRPTILRKAEPGHRCELWTNSFGHALGMQTDNSKVVEFWKGDFEEYPKFDHLIIYTPFNVHF